MVYRYKVNRTPSMRTTTNGRPVGTIRACWIHVYDAIRAHPMCRNGELSGDRAVISEPTRCASTTGPRARERPLRYILQDFFWPGASAIWAIRTPGCVSGDTVADVPVHATTLRVFFTYATSAANGRRSRPFTS